MPELTAQDLHEAYNQTLKESPNSRVLRTEWKDVSPSSVDMYQRMADLLNAKLVSQVEPQPTIALLRNGLLYCPPCMTYKQVEESDRELNQAEVDAQLLHPGWHVLCSRCNKVLSSKEENK